MEKYLDFGVAVLLIGTIWSMLQKQISKISKNSKETVKRLHDRTDTNSQELRDLELKLAVIEERLRIEL